jgi:hypothetical protein
VTRPPFPSSRTLGDDAETALLRIAAWLRRSGALFEAVHLERVAREAGEVKGQSADTRLAQ